MKKPLGIKCYGSIPHLSNSKLGIGDHHCHEGHEGIATIKKRDKNDVVYVQEKLDGTCVSIAKHNGELFALTRSGYTALSSPYKQHHVFANWALQNIELFHDLLNEDERIVGEWLYQAHGTKYSLKHIPFVGFDILKGHERMDITALYRLLNSYSIPTPYLVHAGDAISVNDAMNLLGDGKHGAEKPEGLIYRVERNSKVDFLCKYVRPDYQTGIYLPEVSGLDAVYNLKGSMHRSRLPFI